jgi:hypothetical protein
MKEYTYWDMDQSEQLLYTDFEKKIKSYLMINWDDEENLLCSAIKNKDLSNKTLRLIIDTCLDKETRSLSETLSFFSRRGRGFLKQDLQRK